MTIKCRRFQGKEDYFKLREFIEESISVSGTKFYFNLNDLGFAFDLYEDESHIESAVKQLDNTFLWFEDEKLIGGIWVFNRMQLFLNPKKKYIFKEMLEVAEETVKEFIKEGNENISVNDYSECSWRIFEGDSELESVLIENGYYRTDEYWVLRDFDYSEAIEEPKLPEGYYIKTLSELSELSDTSKVIQIYGDCLGMGFDEYSLRNTNKFNVYRDELDIIVMNPDHKPVALCSGRYDEKNKMVSFEAVDCFRDHRKKGISKAMMLYESAGFKLVGNRYTWKKIKE